MPGSPWERRGPGPAKPKPGGRHGTLTLLAQWALVFLVTQLLVVSLLRGGQARGKARATARRPPSPHACPAAAMAPD